MSLSHDTDGLFDLAEGLLGYLTDLADCRAICMRHEPATAVRDDAGWLAVRQWFPSAGVTDDELSTRAAVLPGWEDTLFWPSEGRAWEREVSDRSMPDELQGMPRGIEWEGRPVLLSITRPRVRGARLVFTTVLPPLPLDLPEPPLRKVALALRCHVRLLPHGIAAEAANPADGWLRLRPYLERAAPQNRYASQCFSLPGAETYPSRPPRPRRTRA